MVVMSEPLDPQYLQRTSESLITSCSLGAAVRGPGEQAMIQAVC